MSCENSKHAKLEYDVEQLKGAVEYWKSCGKAAVDAGEKCIGDLINQRAELKETLVGIRSEISRTVDLERDWTGTSISVVLSGETLKRIREAAK
jgi:hypothetical protein